jgi:hypothetical protein
MTFVARITSRKPTVLNMALGCFCSSTDISAGFIWLARRIGHLRRLVNRTREQTYNGKTSCVGPNVPVNACKMRSKGICTYDDIFH